ncbi:MAG: polysaccharide lyase family 8 super-sandwich domain-containing protein, partial [Bacteroidota bacterium]
ELNGITNAGKSASKKRGNSLFSGGVGEGGLGVGAFEMKLGEYFPNSNTWDEVNGAGALKGNFFFSEEMVCLGQEIKRIKSGSDEIWTTLNQLQRRGDVVYALDQGNPVTIGLNQTINQTLQINGTAWFWHDRIGYLIQAGTTTDIKLIGERRSLHPVLMQDEHYRDALSQEDRDLGSINMFQLAINHGTDPTNDRYVYKVIPDISLADFQQYTSPSIVARNSNKIQAVSNPADSVLQVVFYEPGSLALWGGKSVAVDKKAIIMLRQSQGELFVSVANPVHRGLTPSFVESNSPTIGELYTDPVNVTLGNFGIAGETEGTYVVPVQLPVDRGYEGQTVTEVVQFKTDGGLPTDIEGIVGASPTRIYPNPHTHVIDIEPAPFMEKLELFDLEGKQILVLPINGRKRIRLDSKLPQGTYLLKLSGRSGTETHKIVKQ